MTSPALTHWVLTIVCEDQPGIVHAISGAILAANGNITEAHQYTSHDTGRFFMRLQVESAVPREFFENQLLPVTQRYSMDWNLDVVGRKVKTLVLVSKSGHCLNDLLFRQRAGQLPIEIPAVMGNHSDLGEMAQFYSVPFEEHKISSDADKKAFEDRLRTFIAEEKIELVVLARYMQILSEEFCKEFEGRIINIHHSFLPGFKGANPYAQAHSRGVKLIGATAHFVTADLDEGPIIEQNVVRVEHSDSKNRLVSIGQDVESKTLTQAVRWFAESRVLLDGARTVIFN
ncbi:MAG: formyltetrahydrofolate deformylase [Actinomycetota bacterium]|jgi:formyltetrahydrofolate deformylase|uniref:Formyltetrahydrofolate deformylase n=1 Tax=Candidatus Rhodoluna planktonica TaxID=535712 RepID=A0A1D9E031_9MICO|nr:formyltetrahydrofolate deformylase [Candidatus Rhodoluna planktonica]AOY56432.1 formyltetrahydrofolate deformylase [Candidatus Rhodoluna planktonica]